MILFQQCFPDYSVIKSAISNSIIILKVVRLQEPLTSFRFDPKEPTENKYLPLNLYMGLQEQYYCGHDFLKEFCLLSSC